MGLTSVLGNNHISTSSGMVLNGFKKLFYWNGWPNEFFVILLWAISKNKSASFRGICKETNRHYKKIPWREFRVCVMYTQRSRAAENLEVQHILISSLSAVPERMIPSRLCRVSYGTCYQKGLRKPVRPYLWEYWRTWVVPRKWRSFSPQWFWLFENFMRGKRVFFEE